MNLVFFVEINLIYERRCYTKVAAETPKRSLSTRTWRMLSSRLLAKISETTPAVMLKHIHRGKNRSVLRAIAEINACDKQFAPEWIAPFNSVIRKTIES